MVFYVNNIQQKKKKMDFEKYFAMLVDWKKLPAYKLEPRIDAFIGFYLPEIIGEYKETNIIGIIPEFPLRCRTLYPDNKKFTEKSFGERAFKVDFLLISEKKPHYLIEFKTDLDSRSDEQDDYLEKAKDIKLRELIKGIKFIYKATKAKTKYEYLISKLQEISLMNDNFEFIGKNEDLEIIYIQPSNKEKKDNVIDFQEICKWFDKKQNIDLFEKKLSETLRLFS
jgi:hypothetical protein